MGGQAGIATTRRPTPPARRRVQKGEDPGSSAIQTASEHQVLCEASAAGEARLYRKRDVQSVQTPGTVCKHLEHLHLTLGPRGR